MRRTEDANHAAMRVSSDDYGKVAVEQGLEREVRGERVTFVVGSEPLHVVIADPVTEKERAQRGRERARRRQLLKERACTIGQILETMRVRKITQLSAEEPAIVIPANAQRTRFVEQRDTSLEIALPV